MKIFRRRFLWGGVVALLGAALLVVTVVGPAQATYFSGGFGSGFFYLKPYSYNSQWQGPMDRAIANWNATATPADIQKLSGSANSVTAASYGSETWFGYYNRYSTSFTIRLNSATMGNGCSNFGNCVTSVFVHELGHALYLADNPPVASTASIMRYDRNRSTMTTPRSYDISEVNAYN